MIRSSAKVSGLNIRKTKEGSDRVVAIDVKINEVLIDDELISRLLGVDGDAALWDEDGNRLHQGIEFIRTWGALTGVQCELDRHVMLGELKKFELTPTADRTALMSCVLHLSDPPDHIAPVLAHMVGEEISLRAEIPQVELDLAS